MVKQNSICLFCSKGCKLAFTKDQNNAFQVAYDEPICARGHYNLEMLKHPLRFFNPNMDIDKVKAQVNSGSLAILLSGLASLETVYLAAKLAQKHNTNNIDIIGSHSDFEAMQAEKWQANATIAKIQDIGTEDALFIIGDVLTRSPVMSSHVNKVKYAKRGNQIIVLDPLNSHTAWFATAHLKNTPGTEALVLAAMLAPDKVDCSAAGITKEKLAATLDSFNKAGSGTIIFAPGKDKKHNDLILFFIKKLCEKSGNKKYLVLYEYGNALGAKAVLSKLIPDHCAPHAPVDTLLVLGDGDRGTCSGNWTLSQSYFHDPRKANCIFPLASQFETTGTYMLADQRIEKVPAIASPAGLLSSQELLEDLLDEEIDLDINFEKGFEFETINVDLNEKIELAKSITGSEKAHEEQVTHFGNNDLVKNFFWYKVNN